MRYCSKCFLEKDESEFTKINKLCKPCQRIYNKEYYIKNKSNIRKIQNKYEKERKIKDPNFKLLRLLRDRTRKALKNKYKIGSAIKDLGCTIEELKIYLESKFQPGMTWDNHGKWEIDHIKPLSKFDLTDPTQFSEASHYTNLQPLWKEDNRTKKDKYEKDSTAS